MNPTCPKHGTDLVVVEEGVLNGTLVRYWGGCPGTTSKFFPCVWHKANPWTPREWCVCRGGKHFPCHYETRTEDTSHDEPDLFGAAS